MRTSRTKKQLGAILCSIVILVSGMGATPQKAHAAIPVVDVVQQPKELLVDAAMKGLMMVALNLQVGMIANFASNHVVEDIAEYYAGHMDDVSRDIATEVGGIRTLSDFGSPTYKARLANSLRENNVSDLSNKFADAMETTADDKVVGGDLRAFYHDFSRGNWDAWRTSFRNPTEIQSGATAAAHTYLIRQKTQRGAKLDGELSGKNFKPKKSNGMVETPSNIISDQLNQAMQKGLEQMVASDEVQEMVTGLIQSVVMSRLNSVI